MQTYIVIRDAGYPVSDPSRKFGEIFESDSKEDAAGAEAGYLLVAEVENPAFTADLAERVLEFRKEKAEREAAEKDASEKREADANAQKAVDEKAEKDAAAAKVKAEAERRQKVSSLLGEPIKPKRGGAADIPINIDTPK